MKRKTINLNVIMQPPAEKSVFRVTVNLTGIYIFTVNNGYNRTMREICSKLTIKTPERCH